MTREHDVVLFGATGFTGALTAEYLARHAPAGLRWALAGRNRSKLEAVRDRVGADVPLLHADVTDPASLADVAAGTDYVDLTGEPEFVDLMYLAHHATAERTGARIVRAGAMFSGGTFHSAMGAFARARRSSAVHRERRAAEPRPEGRRSRAVAGKPHRDPDLGYWLLPLPTIDPMVVARSGAALASYARTSATPTTQA